MANDNTLLLVAGLLGAAAWLLVEDQAQAAGSSPDVNGFANNNPGNLRYIAVNPFRGQTGNNKGYGIYDTMEDGVRAMGLTLGQYYSSGLTTASGIITKYSPPSENDTAAYIDSVCGVAPGNPYAMNISPDEPLSWPDDRLQLVMAMIYQEQGSNPLSASDVETWLGS